MTRYSANPGATNCNLGLKLLNLSYFGEYLEILIIRKMKSQSDPRLLQTADKIISNIRLPELAALIIISHVVQKALVEYQARGQR
jgi:hypothetical protein